MMGPNRDETAERGCTAVGEMADRYVSRELPEPMRRTIEEHIGRCPKCARLLGDRARVAESLKRAVRAEEVGDEVLATVTAALRREESPAVAASEGKGVLRLFTGSRWYLAAAAVAVIALGVWQLAPGLFGSRQNGSLTDAPSRRSIVATPVTAAPVADILRVGLADHVHCAITARQAYVTMSASEMRESLGPEYVGLLPIVRSVWRNDRLVSAHRCKFAGRPFVHMIFSGANAEIVSLAITRKSGESFASQRASAIDSVDGIALFETRIDDGGAYGIVGFETPEYLVFVVGDAVNAVSLRRAKEIVRPVSALLRGVSE